MTAPTRRAILGRAGAILAVGAVAAPVALASTEHIDADLLALCARIETVQRRINSTWIQGCGGPRYWVPASYIADEDAHEAAPEPLEAEESDLLDQMMLHPPATIEGVRAIPRCLTLHEPDLRSQSPDPDMRYFHFTDQGEAIVFWLFNALTGGEIRPATCMSEPGQLFSGHGGAS